MAVNWMRRTTLAVACTAAALLSAWGSSSIESALAPERVIAFGDGYSAVGEHRYTVNNGSINNWTLQLLDYYQRSGNAAGGLINKAEGYARLIARPDAAGQTSTRPLAEQIDTFLATQALAPNDIVLVNGGISDLVAGMPAEVMIKIEDRTVLDYMIKPLSDMISRSFNEE